MPCRQFMIIAVCLLVGTQAHAQDATPRPDTSGWSLGAIALVHDSVSAHAAGVAWRLSCGPSVGLLHAYVGCGLGAHPIRHICRMHMGSGV